MTFQVVTKLLRTNVTSWKLIFRREVLSWMMRNWEEDDLPGRHQTTTYRRDKLEAYLPS